MPELEAYKGVYLWRYVPNVPAALAFAVLFGIASSAHFWRMWKTKMWFCAWFVLGGFFEVIGYVFRAVAGYHTGSLAPFLIQAIFLVLPPVLFAGSLYMVYSRVVRSVQGNSFSLVSPRWATIFFVLSDLLCMNIQSSGAGLLAKPKTETTGNYMIVAGLIIQVLLFTGFMVCCVTFNTRFRGHLVATGTSRDTPWQSCLNMLYGTSVAILVRNVYRVVEFIMGSDGYLLVNEWPVYVFDASLMLLVMIGFFIWYPSLLRPEARNSMIELSTDAASTATHDDTPNTKPSLSFLGWAKNLI